MSNPTNPPIKHLDKRVMDRYIRRGNLTDKDVQEHLAGLPDLDGQYEVVSLTGEDADDNGEDDATENNQAS